jgi:uncharacterized membrane protein YccC
MSEPARGPRELELLEALTRTLEASEKRRQCSWCLEKIGQKKTRLKQMTPSQERTFAEIFEALDCYINLTFESAEDLETVGTFLSLVLTSMAELEKGNPSSDDYGRHTALCHEILDELGTLDEGIPPRLSAADKLIQELCHPEQRDAEKQAVRDRAKQRVIESIKKGSA